MRPVAISILSTKGKRQFQEDFVTANKDRGIFVVADGFGGPDPGAEASQSACAAVREFLEKEAGDVDATLPFELRHYYSLAGNILFNAFLFANKQLIKINQNRSVHDRGGASVVAAYIDGPILAIGAVGGCSAWLIRGGKCSPLIQPRTYGRLLDPHHWEKLRQTREEYAAPLTALGLSADLEPEITEYRLQRGDWLLLHSDGLKPEIRDRISELQSQSDPLEKRISQANQWIKKQESIDNTSISLGIF